MKYRTKLVTLPALAAALLFAIAPSLYAASSDQTGSNQQSEAVQQHNAAKVKHQERALEAHGGKRAQHNMEAVGHGEQEDDVKKGETVPPPNPDED